MKTAMPMPNVLDFLVDLKAGRAARSEVWHEIDARLNENKLVGYVRATYEQLIPKEIKFKYDRITREQSLINDVLLSSCREIEKLFIGNNIIPIRLKGSALISDIYLESGARHLTDIDLLVAPESKSKAENILHDLNFIINEQIVWEANAYKTTFEKRHPSGLMLYIDLHTQLFWQQNLAIELKTLTRHELFDEKLHDQHYITILTPEFQLAHLIANWAYQDNFISLNKLVDIDLLTKKYSDIADSSDFKNLLKSLRLENSWHYVKTALNYLNHSNAKSRLFFSKKFLNDPRHNKFNYGLIKHLTKDSLWQALDYDIKWLQAYL